MKVTSNQKVSGKNLITKIAREAAAETIAELSASGVLTAENFRRVVIENRELLESMIKSTLKTVVRAALL